MTDGKKKYRINLGFKEANIPPFKDILIIGNKCEHGKCGIAKCFNLLLPDEFELVEVKNDKIDGILVSKRLLAKIDLTQILFLLEKNVFPYVSPGEIIRVDFDLNVIYEDITLEE